MILENKNRKISEFDKIELEDQDNLSYVLIPLSIYNSEKNSYTNAVIDINDVIKTSYSSVIDGVFNDPLNLWETYGEDNTILDLSEGA